MSKGRFIGLDVHADTIAAAVAEPDGKVRSMGVIPNRPESIRKLVKKPGAAARGRRCGSSCARQPCRRPTGNGGSHPPGARCPRRAWNEDRKLAIAIEEGDVAQPIDRTNGVWSTSGWYTAFLCDTPSGV